LTHSLNGQAGSSLLVRTISVTIVVMTFFGVATGALPVRCWVGGLCDSTGKPTVVTVLPSAAQPRAAAPVAVVPAVAKATPTLTSNDVIAATFAQLKVELRPPTAPETSPTRVASVGTPPAAATITNPETGLSKRVVRAITVHANGTPDLASGLAEAYADSRPKVVIPPSPAVDAAARIGAGQTPVLDEEAVADLSPESAAPTAGLAVVAGKGANVRSSPSKTGGNVLFALRGGAKVTIVESKHNWMRIKDDQGRNGWIYGDGLSKG